MDDRDIRIVFDNLAEVNPGSLKRPIDTTGLDIDDISQTSFNTQQGPTRTKQARFGSPQSHQTTAQISHLEAERAAQDAKISNLESQLAQLMVHFASVTSPSTGPTPSPPEDRLDEDP